MATTNGARTPPAPSLLPSHTTTATTSAHKRKRDDGDHQSHPAPPAPASSDDDRHAKQTQRDLLEVLQQHDTTPSLLHLPLADPTAEPAAHKKAKLEVDSKRTSTTADRLASGAYLSLAALKEDAGRASRNIVAEIRSKVKEADVSLSVGDLKAIQKVLAFEQRIKDVVDQEIRRRGDFRPTPGADAPDIRVKMSNAKTDSSRGGAVLTLFGNAPTPKQLFSSTPSGPIKLPVEEMSLPAGLTATQILPATYDDTKKLPTFEETFAPPYSLPQLLPPKSHKRSSTRDAAITWEFKDLIGRNAKKGGYTLQSQSVGDWLGYGGVDSDVDATSPREKRKQRDRALSSSDGQKERPRLDDGLAIEREEWALFRRAYSSFMPSHDDAKALVPEQTKSMLWWYKTGEQRFQERFALDPALNAGGVVAPVDGVLSSERDKTAEDHDEFGPAVQLLEAADEDMTDGDVAGTTPVSKGPYTIAHVQKRVSLLLETLASHQRNRNSTLSPSVPPFRTPVSPGLSLGSKPGTPSSPDSSEIETYTTLRHELAHLILLLPPHAVAKLPTGNLAVSTLLPFHGPNYKGTLEEDALARLARYNTLAAAAGFAPHTRAASSTPFVPATNAVTNQYATPVPSYRAGPAAAIGQAAVTRYPPPLYGAGAASTASRSAALPVAQLQQQQQYSRPSAPSAHGQGLYGTPSATSTSGTTLNRPAYAQQQSYGAKPSSSSGSYHQASRSQGIGAAAAAGSGSGSLGYGEAGTGDGWANRHQGVALQMMPSTNPPPISAEAAAANAEKQRQRQAQWAQSQAQTLTRMQAQAQAQDQVHPASQRAQGATTPQPQLQVQAPTAPSASASAQQHEGEQRRQPIAPGSPSGRTASPVVGKKLTASGAGSRDGSGNASGDASGRATPVNSSVATRPALAAAAPSGGSAATGGAARTRAG